MKGGGFAAAHRRARRAGYGAAPPAPRVLRIALRDSPSRAALDPGDHCEPWARKNGQAQACPAMRSARNPAVAEHRPLSPVQAVVSAVPRKVPELHPDGSRLVSRPLFRQPAPEPAPPHRQAETEPNPFRRGHITHRKGKAAPSAVSGYQGAGKEEPERERVLITGMSGGRQSSLRHELAAADTIPATELAEHVPESCHPSYRIEARQLSQVRVTGRPDR